MTFLGELNFDCNDALMCKIDAKAFLEKLLCDGIHVLYTHYWLIEKFYHIIQSLIDFINQNDSGVIREELSGNYDGTVIKVEILN